MGISVQASGIMVEKNKYYLVNLNADPSLNELLVYYLKDRTLVGAKVNLIRMLKKLSVQTGKPLFVNMPTKNNIINKSSKSNNNKIVEF